MKKLLLCVLLLPTLALAEPVKINKEVLCDRATDMLTYFSEKYKEKPLWIGNSDDTNVALIVNQETQTWTVVQFNAEKNIACFIEAGKGFKFRLPGDPT